jgi:hypothetical protein
MNKFFKDGCLMEWIIYPVIFFVLSILTLHGKINELITVHKELKSDVDHVKADITKLKDSLESSTSDNAAIRNIMNNELLRISTKIKCDIASEVNDLYFDLAPLITNISDKT